LPPVKHSTSQSSTMARSDKEAEMSQKSLLKFVPFSILETQSLQTNVLHCNEARIAYRKNEHNEDGACQMAARCIHHREDCEMIWFSEYITVDLLPPTLVTSVQQPRRHCTSIYIIQYYIYIYYIFQSMLQQALQGSSSRLDKKTSASGQHRRGFPALQLRWQSSA